MQVVYLVLSGSARTHTHIGMQRVALIWVKRKNLNGFLELTPEFQQDHQ